MIVSILNQKGGSGKTTIAVNLARALQQDNASVLLVDSDPQGSARDWHAAGDGELVTVVGLDRPTLHKDIKAIAKSYDWVLIDGAPQLSDMAVSAIKCSDIILIPVQPSPYDVWATQDLVDVIKARQQVTDGMPRAAFVISRRIANTTLGQEVRQVLSEYELPVFKASTVQRVIYAKTAATGSTVLDVRQDSDAAQEIRQLMCELKDFSQC
jgi:chromosome partitioning protein